MYGAWFHYFDCVCICIGGELFFVANPKLYVDERTSEETIKFLQPYILRAVGVLGRWVFLFQNGDVSRVCKEAFAWLWFCFFWVKEKALHRG